MLQHYIHVDGGRDQKMTTEQQFHWHRLRLRSGVLHFVH